MRSVVLMTVLLAPAVIQAAGRWGNTPLTFEENRGQARPGARFVARSSGLLLELAPGEATLRARSAPELRMRLDGASARTRLEGLDPVPTRSHYFQGSDSRNWRIDVPHFARVAARQAWPGIDVIWYGRGRQLEYDVTVAPGADPRDIRLSFEGVRRIRVDHNGDLLLETGSGQLRQHRPVSYQSVGGQRRIVDAGYRIVDRKTVAFRVGAYDRAIPLVIDPVLSYSGFLGGNAIDQANAVAVDSSGSAYIAGYTESLNFAQSGAFQSVHSGGRDAFVTKLNAAGDAIVWSTFLGGNSGDEANAITVDASGSAYVVGTTGSPNYPLVSPFQNQVNRTQSAGGAITDAFVTRLSPAGNTLVFSTYLGGGAFDGFTGIDVGLGVAIDSTGIYVTGMTSSNNFPVMNTIEPVRGLGDVFVTKLNPAGTALIYSTYLGGFGRDSGNGIAVDRQNNAYVTGETRSANFPVANAMQPNHGGSADAFVVKINSAGSALVYSTYLGGNGVDTGRGIAVDASGAAYVTGDASSTLPTTPGVVHPGSPAGPEAFVAKLNPEGTAFSYLTYIAGNGTDEGRAIAVDSTGSAYVAGWTTSTDLPVRDAFQGNTGVEDGFLAKLNPTASEFSFLTYLGGAARDQINALALDNSGAAYLAGVTESTNFRVTTGALQRVFGGGMSDGFAARIGDLFTGQLPVAVMVSPSTLMLSVGGSQQFTATVSNAVNTAVTWSLTPQVGTISATGLYTAPAVIGIQQNVTVTATSVADPTKSASAIVTLTPPSPPLVVTVVISPSSATLTDGQTQQFTATVTGAANTAVTWTINPQVGSISLTGLYTAPASVAAAASVTVTVSSVADPTKSATATITLAPPGPFISVAGAVNAASGASLSVTGVSPGLIVTFYGLRLGPAAPIFFPVINAQGLVDTTLSEVRIFFDGVPAPMIAVVSTQVSAVAPYGIGARAMTQVQVEYRGQRSNIIALPVSRTAPGLFTANQSGRGQGAIINEDNVTFNADVAAPLGSIVVIYATGEGETNPSGVDGKPATTVPLPAPLAQVTVTIGGIGAEVTYRGAAPLYVGGLFQVNARIPAAVTPGDAVPVVVTVGNVSSQAGVTLRVR